MCGSTAGIEVAHVRLGSGAGLSQKPDDWATCSLCRDCHARQHTVGERTFWQGRDLEALVEFFIKSSPRRHEIEQVRRERGA